MQSKNLESKDLKSIVIQGAMGVEIEYYIKHLSNVEEIQIAGYTFYKGILFNYPAIISKTEIGTINAGVATAIAIMEFKPLLIINQGIAGAHKEEMKIGDIVVAKDCIHIHNLSTKTKEFEEGSNSFEWEYTKRAKDLIPTDEKIFEIAKNIPYKKGTIFCGRIGSGDIFNREKDRIKWITQKKDTLCEEMEGIGTYQTSSQFQTPCIGIRIISNNELTGEKLDESVAVNLQQFILDMIKEYIKLNCKL